MFAQAAAVLTEMDGDGNGNHAPLTAVAHQALLTPELRCSQVPSTSPRCVNGSWTSRRVEAGCWGLRCGMSWTRPSRCAQAASVRCSADVVVESTLFVFSMPEDVRSVWFCPLFCPLFC